MPMSSDDAALNQLVRRERRVQRIGVAVAVAMIVQFLWLFWWFSDVVGATLPADVWVSADQYAREGRGVLIDVSSRDAKSGRVIAPGPISVVIRGSDGSALKHYTVEGEDRRMLVQPRGGLTIEATLRDERIGDQSVTRRVETAEHAEWERLPARGGAIPPPGHAGLHAVTLRGECDVDVDAVAVGGVPVVGVRNLLLFRVRARSGLPVGGVRLNVSASSAPMEDLAPTTDVAGVAVFRFVPQELEYVELEGICDEGTFARGFELQPVWDGLSVSEFKATVATGMRAVVDDFSAGLGSLWDVHCGGDAVAYGTLSSGGVVEVPPDRFDRVEVTDDCVLQVYRDSFSRESGRALRPFTLRKETAGDLWRLSAEGVGFHRQAVLGRASEKSPGMLAQWRGVRLAWVSRLLGFNAIVLSLLWALMAWEATRTRGLRRRLTYEVEEVSASRGASWDRRAFARSLLAGWSALALVLGGIWMLFSLMGLYA